MLPGGGEGGGGGSNIWWWLFLCQIYYCSNSSILVIAKTHTSILPRISIFLAVPVVGPSLCLFARQMLLLWICHNNKNIISPPPQLNNHHPGLSNPCRGLFREVAGARHIIIGLGTQSPQLWNLLVFLLVPCLLVLSHTP